MPSYHYKCKCNEIVVDIQAIKDRKETKRCPKCGKKCKRIFGTPNVSMDYSDMDYMGSPRFGELFAEANEKKCGVPT